jgi:pantoate--beta-alanine ligase
VSVAVHHTVAQFRGALDAARAQGKNVGLVPTMGALHAGHGSLVRAARARADVVAVTIFVNPTQFGPNEDFARYPRTLEQDLALAEAEGATHVFAPEASEMYPAGERTRVHVSGLTDALCGPHRPGHFDGVATIVSKLFLATGSCLALFGRKDYQQLKVIERMARDLLMPVEVVGLPTVRAPDGLALSSRNAYLSSEERARALAIPESLSRAVLAFAAGERGAAALRTPVAQALERAASRVDYVTLADADTLTPLADDRQVGERAVLALAGFWGATRLIDNVVLGEDRPPIASARDSEKDAASDDAS